MSPTVAKLHSFAGTRRLRYSLNATASIPDKTKFTVICVSTSIGSLLRMYGRYRHWLTASIAAGTSSGCPESSAQVFNRARLADHRRQNDRALDARRSRQRGIDRLHAANQIALAAWRTSGRCERWSAEECRQDGLRPADRSTAADRLGRTGELADP